MAVRIIKGLGFLEGCPFMGRDNGNAGGREGGEGKVHPDLVSPGNVQFPLPRESRTCPAHFARDTTHPPTTMKAPPNRIIGVGF
jgi:hypothetical protein